MAYLKQMLIILISKNQIENNSTIYSKQAWFNTIACLDSYTFAKMLLEENDSKNPQDSIYIQKIMFQLLRRRQPQFRAR